jgi:hypothetical protein
MNRYPSQLSNKIERDDIIQDLIAKQEKEEKLSREQVVENQATQERKALDDIRGCCATFKALAPDQWKQFIDLLTDLNGQAYIENAHTPFDYMKKGISPDQWAINKAFLQGQIRILDAITKTLNIDLLQIDQLIKERSKNKSNNFLKNFLTFCHNVLNR